MDDNQPTQPLPDGQRAAYQGPPAAGSPGTAERPATDGTEPFYRRHGLAFAISTLVLGVIVVFGVLGVGAFAVGSILGHSGSLFSHALHDGRGQLPIAPQAPGQGNGFGGNGNGSGGNGNGNGNGQSQRGIVRGTITSIFGSTWLVESQNGRSLTVRTTSSTAYGTPGNAEQAGSFATGDEVIVVGTRSGSTVTATRIVKLADFPLRPPSTPGSTSGPATPGS